MAVEQSTQKPDKKWSPVVGYEGLYEVSDDGQVWSNITNRLMAPWRHHRGHLRVSLSKNGVHKMNQIHRMVYEAHVGPIPPGYVVRHVNDVPDDNRVQNLVAGTYKDNSQDMLRNKGHYKSRVKHCPLGHPLVTSNLVPSQLKRGHRSCLACDRAGVTFRRHPNGPSKQELADRNFVAIAEKEGLPDAVLLSWIRGVFPSFPW